MHAWKHTLTRWFSGYTYVHSTNGWDEVRAVTTWDSHPDNNHPPNNDSLQTDLDLYVTDPYGLPVGISASYDNNYEIVEFNAITTGTYNARASKTRFDGTTEYVGFAYTYV